MNTLGNRRRPKPVFVFHGGKLKKIRERLGLSLSQVKKMTGIATSSLSDYECGKIVPQLHQFKKLCEAYQLDPLEICELMRLQIFEPRLLRDFRKACQKEGETPLQVFYQILLEYSYS